VGRFIIIAVACIAVMLAWGFPAAADAANQASRNVALIPEAQGEEAGLLPTYGEVPGAPGDSFEGFSFSNVALDEIEPSRLAQFDTVVLNQVPTQSLSTAQESALATFVTNGGKLIIHDADNTVNNDYSWLPVPAMSGDGCQNCGNTGGGAEVIENNTLVSNEPSSPYYIDVGELPGNSDAVGDANLLLTTDPRWSVDIVGENSVGVSGAMDAYASDGGVILYNGFDTDHMGEAFPDGVAWLQKIWYDELTQEWDPDQLPHSIPVVGPGGHCGRRSVRVGVVTVCATTVSVNGGEEVATGEVVLDGGVSVGEGPLAIDTGTKQLTLANPAPITLLRSGGDVSLGSAAFTIDGSGATDPVSGTTGLASVSLTSASLGPLGTLRVGSLPFSVPTSGSVSMYLDSAKGGGLVAAGGLSLPILGKADPSGALSLGFFASSSQTVEPLGGSVQVGQVDFGGGWKLSGLQLSYQSASDTWTASGGLSVPIASLQANGSIVGGRLQSLGVHIGGLDVPVGDSGFFFSGFGGSLNGLAQGPLAIEANTEGFWGAPDLPVEPFYLDNVSVKLTVGHSVALNGAVSFVLKNGSPLHGQLHLQLNVNPFSASGTASAEGSLPGVSLKVGGGAGFSAHHFTLAETGSLHAFGLNGSGQAILSDKGLGASGTLCLHRNWLCQSLAFVETWSQLRNFDLPTLTGAEPSKLITVSGVASAGRLASVRVPRGRRLLLIEVRGGTEAVSVRAPGGATYTQGARAKSVAFVAQPEFQLVTIAVARPRAGVWQVYGAPGLQVKAETVHPLSLVRVSGVSPASSSRSRLGPRLHIHISWHGALGAGVRVTLVRRSSPHEAGVGLVGNLPPSGSVEVPVSKLAPGRNYLSLAVMRNGIPFQQVNVPGTVWRSPVKHRAKKHK